MCPQYSPLHLMVLLSAVKPLVLSAPHLFRLGLNLELVLPVCARVHWRQRSVCWCPTTLWSVSLLFYGEKRMKTSCWAESSVGFIAVENVLLSADCRDTFLCDFGLSETVDDNGWSNQAFRGELSYAEQGIMGSFKPRKYMCVCSLSYLYMWWIIINNLCEPSRQMQK